MYESRKQPVLARARFARRLLSHSAVLHRFHWDQKQ